MAFWEGFWKGAGRAMPAAMQQFNRDKEQAQKQDERLRQEKRQTSMSLLQGAMSKDQWRIAQKIVPGLGLETEQQEALDEWVTESQAREIVALPETQLVPKMGDSEATRQAQEASLRYQEDLTGEIQAPPDYLGTTAPSLATGVEGTEYKPEAYERAQAGLEQRSLDEAEAETQQIQAGINRERIREAEGIKMMDEASRLREMGNLYDEAGNPRFPGATESYEAIMAERRRKVEAERARDTAKAFQDQTVRAKDLHSQFIQESKDFKKVRDSYARIKTLKNTRRGEVQMAIMFSFMKMLDPTSVVRENEQVLLDKVDPRYLSLWTHWNNLIERTWFSEEHVANIIDTARVMYQASAAQQTRLLKSYEKKAEAYRVPMEMVVSDKSFVPVPPKDVVAVSRSEAEGLTRKDWLDILEANAKKIKEAEANVAREEANENAGVEGPPPFDLTGSEFSRRRGRKAYAPPRIPAVRTRTLARGRAYETVEEGYYVKMSPKEHREAYAKQLEKVPPEIPYVPRSLRLRGKKDPPKGDGEPAVSLYGKDITALTPSRSRAPAVHRPHPSEKPVPLLSPFQGFTPPEPKGFLSGFAFSEDRVTQVQEAVEKYKLSSIQKEELLHVLFNNRRISIEEALTTLGLNARPSDTYIPAMEKI